MKFEKKQKKLQKKWERKRIIQRFIQQDFPQMVYARDKEVMKELLSEDAEAAFAIFKNYCDKNQIECPITVSSIETNYDDSTYEDLLICRIVLKHAGKLEKVYVLIDFDEEGVVVCTAYYIVINDTGTHYYGWIDENQMLHIDLDPIEYEAFEIERIISDYCCVYAE